MRRLFPVWNGIQWRVDFVYDCRGNLEQMILYYANVEIAAYDTNEGGYGESVPSIGTTWEYVGGFDSMSNIIEHIGMEINDIAIDDLVGWETLARLRSS